MNPQLRDSTEVMPPAQSVLFVDLDGTLVRTDLLYETLMAAIKRNVWVVFLLPVWLLRGRAYLKRRLAQAGPVRVDLLPYDPEVLERIAAERALSRRVVLATATDALIAERVAEHLGIFDGVIASDGTTNLKSRRKLSAIKAWSDAPFDYVGDSAADIPIWLASARAIAVRTHARVLKRVIGAGPQVETIGDKGRGLRAAFRALRPHQWAKNALIFLPLLASHIYFDLSLWVRDAIAFAAFCLCASAVYILNDLLDLDSDRRHPRKCRRPFAAGELPIKFGLVSVVALLAVVVRLGRHRRAARPRSCSRSTLR